MDDPIVMRRNLMLLPLLASLVPPGAADASVLDPAETLITRAQDIPWRSRPTYPKNSVISAPLAGSRTGTGLYYERLYERAAFLCHGPVLRRGFRSLVGE
jgi:hypothetical protein